MFAGEGGEPFASPERFVGETEVFCGIVVRETLDIGLNPEEQRPAGLKGGLLVNMLLTDKLIY